MSKYSGTYCKEHDSYYVAVEYEYYWDHGTWEQPPEDELPILKVLVDGCEITDFFWDYVKDDLEEDVKDYAIENKPYY